MEPQPEGQRLAQLPRTETPKVDKPPLLRGFCWYPALLRVPASRRIHHLALTLSRRLRCLWAAQRLGTDFIAYLAVSFFFTLGMYVYFFLYNLYLLDLGFKENFIGMLTSAMTLGGVAGTLPAGLLANRLGLKNALLVCLALVSTLCALRALATAPFRVLALSFLLGFVSAIWAVTLPPAIAQLTSDENRALGFSLVFIFGIGIGILGARVGGEFPGWFMRADAHLNAPSAKRLTLLLASFLISLAILPALRLRFAVKPAKEKKVYALNPFLLRFLMVMAVWGLAMGVFVPFSSVYFSRYLGMPLKQIGIVDSLSRIPQLIALLAAPLIFRKIGFIRGIVLAQLATSMVLVALALFTNTTVATIAYMAYVTFQWVSEPGLYSLLMDRTPPAERAGASALNFFVLNSVQAIAAPIAGVSFQRLGYPIVLAAAAALALCAGALFGFCLGHIRRRRRNFRHRTTFMEARAFWKNKSAVRRLVAAYVVLPFVPPSLLLSWSWPFAHLSFGDAIGIVLLYAAFGLAAMLFLGAPLLFLYLRLGWTGFPPFMVGGGLCAALTSYVVLRNVRNWPFLEFFVVAGIFCGLLFRLIVFGFRRSFP